MLKKTNCHRLVTTQVTLKSLVDGVRDELATNEPGFDLDINEIPSLDEIYPKLGKETVEHPFKEYPAPATRQPVTDIAAYLHSSGSTGFPKPIPQTYETFIGWASFRKFSSKMETYIFSNFPIYQHVCSNSVTTTRACEWQQCIFHRSILWEFILRSCISCTAALQLEYIHLPQKRLISSPSCLLPTTFSIILEELIRTA